MKIEKIEELFEKHSPFRTLDYGNDNVMDLEDFTDAINQAELEWYKKLEKKLDKIETDSVQGDNSALVGLIDYHFEIQNKIKELENDNDRN